jgi:hypothetical protein
MEYVKFAYVAQFLIAFSVSITMLFGYFVEYERNPVRIFRFPILMGTMMSGLVLYELIDASSRKRRLGFTVLVGSLIIAMVVLSLGSVYGSPMVSINSQQVTNMEIAGTKWFGDSKSPDLGVIENSPGQMGRFEDYVFGVDSSQITRKDAGERIPSHFGYDTHDRIAQTLNFTNSYLVIFELDKFGALLFPENVRPKVHQFTEEDFAKLDSDVNVAELYCNGEFEVYGIYGARAQK